MRNRLLDEPWRLPWRLMCNEFNLSIYCMKFRTGHAEKLLGYICVCFVTPDCTSVL